MRIRTRALNIAHQRGTFSRPSCPKPQFSLRGDFLKFYAKAREQSGRTHGLADLSSVPEPADFRERVSVDAGGSFAVVEDFNLVARLADAPPPWLPEETPFEKEKKCLGELLYALRLYCSQGISEFRLGPRWLFQGDLNFCGLESQMNVALKQGLQQARLVFTFCDAHALVPFDLAERIPWSLVVNVGRDEWAGVTDAIFYRNQLALPPVLNMIPETRDLGINPGFVDLRIPVLSGSPDFLFVNEEPFFQQKNVIDNLLAGIKIWQPRMIYWLWYKAPRAMITLVETDLKRSYHTRYFESGFPDPAIFPYSREQFMRGVDGHAGVLAYR